MQCLPHWLTEMPVACRTAPSCQGSARLTYAYIQDTGHHDFCDDKKRRAVSQQFSSWISSSTHASSPQNRRVTLWIVISKRILMPSTWSFLQRVLACPPVSALPALPTYRMTPELQVCLNKSPASKPLRRNVTSVNYYVLSFEFIYLLLPISVSYSPWKFSPFGPFLTIFSSNSNHVASAWFQPRSTNAIITYSNHNDSLLLSP